MATQYGLPNVFDDVTKPPLHDLHLNELKCVLSSVESRHRLQEHVKNLLAFKCD